MKLGISSPLEHHSPSQWARQQKELGCEAVVFPVDCKAEDSLVDEYVKAAQEYDLQIAEVGIWRNAISKDEAERSAAMEYSIGQLKLADRIHARCCVNVSGSAGARWDGAYAENFSRKTRDAAVRMIQEVIDEAKPQNTWFTIEPMPWMIPSGPEEYVKLLEDVARDRFAVHMDIINMINCPERYFFAEDFLKRCFDLLGDRIRSCHLSLLSGCWNAPAEKGHSVWKNMPVWPMSVIRICR